MKKIVIILLILAAGVGSPFWVGKQIEEQLPAYLQRAAEVGQFNIELTSYNRRLFRSDAVTRLTFYGVKNEQVVLRHTVWHGPWPIGQTRSGHWQLAPAAAVIETTLNADTPQSGTLGDLLERLPGFGALYDLSVVSFSGGSVSEFSIPPFSQDFTEDGDRIHFEWGGLKSSSSATPRLTRIDNKTTISGIRISDPSSESEIADLVATFKVHEDPSGLLLGNVTLDCAKVSTGPRDAEPEFSLKGFQLRNAAKLDGVTVNYAIEVAVDEIGHPTMNFAPAGFEVLFSRLDAATILAVQHELQKLQSNIVSLPENDIMRQVSEIYLAALPALLQKKPEISLNYLRAQNTDGEIWARGKLTLLDDSKGLITLDNLSRLIDVNGEAQISRALLQKIIRQTIEPNMEKAWQDGQFGDISREELNNMIDVGSQQQIGAFVQQGMLTFDGDNYKIDFSYSNQQAMLNGLPLED